VSTRAAAFLLILAVAGRSAGQTVVTVAGGGTGDGGPATSAHIESIGDLLLDAAGNVFVTDLTHASIRRIDAASRMITTVLTWDPKNPPAFLAWRGPGKLLFSTGIRVEEFDLATLRRRTVAGNGTWLYREAGIEFARPADQAPLGPVQGLAVDAHGSVCFGDPDRDQVLRVDPSTGRLEILFAMDRARDAGGGSLDFPISDLAFDSAGVLYFADGRHHRVYCVVSGRAIPIAGTGEPRRSFPREPGSGMGQSATAATETPLDRPTRLGFRAGYELALGEGHGTVRLVDRNRRLAFLIGAYFEHGLVSGLDFDREGTLFAARATESGIEQIVRLPKDATEPQLLAGSGLKHCCGDGASGPDAVLSEPEGIAVAPNGDLLVADRANHRIRRISTRTGRVSTIAGGGIFALPGSRHIAFQKRREPPPPGRIHALLFEALEPRFVSADAAGNVYFAPREGPVYRIDAIDGAIVALGADRKNALGAKFPDGFAGIGGIAVDRNGTVFVAAENRIWRLSPDGKIGALAGTGHEGFNGDGDYGTLADLSRPAWPVLDGQGSLYFVDAGNARIRKVDRNGRISTVAGNGLTFPSGPGLAVRESVGIPTGLALDPKGDLAWATGDGRIWQLQVATGQIRRVAGSDGAAGRPSPDGPLNGAFKLGTPRSLAFDRGGAIYFSDGDSDTVRAIRP
jgi:sugar lactone lactonase YvrE